jgi:hypothetical protein
LPNPSARNETARPLWPISLAPGIVPGYINYTGCKPSSMRANGYSTTHETFMGLDVLVAVAFPVAGFTPDADFLF